MSAGFRRVLLVGKRRDKIEFMKEFLPKYDAVQLEEICCKEENILIQLKHCSSYKCKVKRNSSQIVMIDSFWFPAGLILEADMNIRKRWIDSPIANSCGMVLFLCSYPWKTAEFLNNLRMIPEHLCKNISNQPVQYCVVRWIDPNQRFGSTDLINPEKVIAGLPDEICQDLKQSTQTEFVSSILEYPIYRNRQDFLKVISGSGKTLTILTEESKKRFEKWHKKVKEFPSEYFPEHADYLGTYLYDFPIDLQEKFENLTSHETFRQATSFQTVQGCKNIVHKFRDRYYQQYYSIILRAVDEIYKANIEEICFWNLEQDIAQLHSEIEKRYYEIFKDVKSASCPKTQRDYQNILHKSKYDIFFIEKTTHFLQDDMMHIIYNHILEKEKVLASFLYQETRQGGF